MDFTNANYLFRGINKDMLESANRKLVPKGDIQDAQLYPSQYLFPSEKLFPGNHYLNAVDIHQNENRFDQDDFKNRSAYLSTTPHFERAKYYATKGNALVGYVFVLDRTKLAKYQIEEFIVSEIATDIKVPEDEEVLLRTNPLGSPIVKQVIIDVIEVEPSS